MRILTMILTIILITLGVTFSFLNATPVTVSYYLGTSTLPLALLLLIVFFIGFSVGSLMISIQLLRAKNSLRKLRKKYQACEQQLAQLRSTPPQE